MIHRILHVKFETCIRILILLIIGIGRLINHKKKEFQVIILKKVKRQHKKQIHMMWATSDHILCNGIGSPKRRYSQKLHHMTKVHLLL